MKTQTILAMQGLDDSGQSRAIEIYQFTTQPIWNIHLLMGVEKFNYESVNSKKNVFLLQADLQQIMRTRIFSFLLHDQQNIARDLLNLQVNKKKLKSAKLGVVIGKRKIDINTKLEHLPSSTELHFSNINVQVSSLSRTVYLVGFLKSTVVQVYK